MDDLYCKLRALYRAQDELPKLIDDDRIGPQSLKDCCFQLRVITGGDESGGAITVESLLRDAGRVVVAGGAGFGKSTMLHYMTYIWSLGEPLQHRDAAADATTAWTGSFDSVLRVPLRVMSQVSAKQPMAALIEMVELGLNAHDLYDPHGDMYFTENEVRLLLFEDGNTRKGPRPRVLLLLDGFDEVAQETRKTGTTARKVLDVIFREFRHFVITTRPESIEFLRRHANITHEIENVGLGTDGVLTILRSFFKVDAARGARLEQFLGAHPQVLDMCTVPINMALLCVVWTPAMESKLRRGLGIIDLYEEVVLWLGRRYYCRAEMDVNEETLVVDIMGNPVMKYVLRLAFDAMLHGEQRLSRECMQRAKQCDGLESVETKKLYDLGVVKPESGSSSAANKDEIVHTFIHMSFQEYFAALRLFQKLKSETSMPWCTPDGLELADVPAWATIERIRDSSRWLMTLKFLAGMVARDMQRTQQSSASLCVACVFWESVACHRDGIVELSDDLKLQRLMHLLAQSNWDREKIPNGQAMFDFVDDHVETRHWPLVITSGFMSPRIAHKAHLEQATNVLLHFRHHPLLKQDENILGELLKHRNTFAAAFQCAVDEASPHTIARVGVEANSLESLESLVGAGDFQGAVDCLMALPESVVVGAPSCPLIHGRLVPPRRSGEVPVPGRCAKSALAVADVLPRIHRAPSSSHETFLQQCLLNSVGFELCCAPAWELLNDIVDLIVVDMKGGDACLSALLELVQSPPLQPQHAVDGMSQALRPLSHLLLMTEPLFMKEYNTVGEWQEAPSMLAGKQFCGRIVAKIAKQCLTAPGALAEWVKSMGEAMMAISSVPACAGLVSASYFTLLEIMLSDSSNETSWTTPEVVAVRTVTSRYAALVSCTSDLLSVSGLPMEPTLATEPKKSPKFTLNFLRFDVHQVRRLFAWLLEDVHKLVPRAAEDQALGIICERGALIDSTIVGDVLRMTLSTIERNVLRRIDEDVCSCGGLFAKLQLASLRYPDHALEVEGTGRAIVAAMGHVSFMILAEVCVHGVASGTARALLRQRLQSCDRSEMEELKAKALSLLNGFTTLLDDQRAYANSAKAASWLPSNKDVSVLEDYLVGKLKASSTFSSFPATALLVGEILGIEKPTDMQPFLELAQTDPCGSLMLIRFLQLYDDGRNSNNKHFQSLTVDDVRSLWEDAEKMTSIVGSWARPLQRVHPHFVRCGALAAAIVDVIPASETVLVLEGVLRAVQRVAACPEGALHELPQEPMHWAVDMMLQLNRDGEIPNADRGPTSSMCPQLLASLIARVEDDANTWHHRFRDLIATLHMTNALPKGSGMSEACAAIRLAISFASHCAIRATSVTLQQSFCDVLLQVALPTRASIKSNTVHCGPSVVHRYFLGNVGVCTASVTALAFLEQWFATLRSLLTAREIVWLGASHFWAHLGTDQIASTVNDVGCALWCEALRGKQHDDSNTQDVLSSMCENVLRDAALVAHLLEDADMPCGAAVVPRGVWALWVSLPRQESASTLQAVVAEVACCTLPTEGTLHLGLLFAIMSRHNVLLLHDTISDLMKRALLPACALLRIIVRVFDCNGLLLNLAESFGERIERAAGGLLGLMAIADDHRASLSLADSSGFEAVIGEALEGVCRLAEHHSTEFVSWVMQTHSRLGAHSATMSHPAVSRLRNVVNHALLQATNSSNSGGSLRHQKQNIENRITELRVAWTTDPIAIASLHVHLAGDMVAETCLDYVVKHRPELITSEWFATQADRNAIKPYMKCLSMLPEAQQLQFAWIRPPISKFGLYGLARYPTNEVIPYYTSTAEAVMAVFHQIQSGSAREKLNRMLNDCLANIVDPHLIITTAQCIINTVEKRSLFLEGLHAAICASPGDTHGHRSLCCNEDDDAETTNSASADSSRATMHPLERLLRIGGVEEHGSLRPWKGDGVCMTLSGIGFWQGVFGDDYVVSLVYTHAKLSASRSVAACIERLSDDDATRESCIEKFRVAIAQCCAHSFPTPSESRGYALGVAQSLFTLMFDCSPAVSTAAYNALKRIIAETTLFDDGKDGISFLLSQRSELRDRLCFVQLMDEVALANPAKGLSILMTVATHRVEADAFATAELLPHVLATVKKRCELLDLKERCRMLESLLAISDMHPDHALDIEDAGVAIVASATDEVGDGEVFGALSRFGVGADEAVKRVRAAYAALSADNACDIFDKVQHTRCLYELHRVLPTGSRSAPPCVASFVPCDVVLALQQTEDDMYDGPVIRDVVRRVHRHYRRTGAVAEVVVRCGIERQEATDVSTVAQAIVQRCSAGVHQDDAPSSALCRLVRFISGCDNSFTEAAAEADDMNSASPTDSTSSVDCTSTEDDDMNQLRNCWTIHNWETMSLGAQCLRLLLKKSDEPLEMLLHLCTVFSAPALTPLDTNDADNLESCGDFLRATIAEVVCTVFVNGEFERDDPAIVTRLLDAATLVADSNAKVLHTLFATTRRLSCVQRLCMLSRKVLKAVSCPAAESVGAAVVEQVLHYFVGPHSPVFAYNSELHHEALLCFRLVLSSHGQAAHASWWQDVIDLLEVAPNDVATARVRAVVETYSRNVAWADDDEGMFGRFVEKASNRPGLAKTLCLDMWARHPAWMIQLIKRKVPGNCVDIAHAYFAALMEQVAHPQECEAPGLGFSTCMVVVSLLRTIAAAAIPHTSELERLLAALLQGVNVATWLTPERIDAIRTMENGPLARHPALLPLQCALQALLLQRETLSVDEIRLLVALSHLTPTVLKRGSIVAINDVEYRAQREAFQYLYERGERTRTFPRAIQDHRTAAHDLATATSLFSLDAVVPSVDHGFLLTLFHDDASGSQLAIFEQRTMFGDVSIRSVDTYLRCSTEHVKHPLLLDAVGESLRKELVWEALYGGDPDNKFREHEMRRFQTRGGPEELCAPIRIKHRIAVSKSSACEQPAATLARLDLVERVREMVGASAFASTAVQRVDAFYVTRPKDNSLEVEIRMHSMSRRLKTSEGAIAELRAGLATLELSMENVNKIIDDLNAMMPDMEVLPALLEREKDLARRAEECACLERNNYTRGLYHELRSQLNGVYVAAQAVMSGIVANSKTGGAGVAGNVLSAISSAIPLVGGAVGCLGAILSAFDEMHQEERLRRFARIAPSSVVMDGIAEYVARRVAQMKISHQDIRATLRKGDLIGESIGDVKRAAMRFLEPPTSVATNEEAEGRQDGGQLCALLVIVLQEGDALPESTMEVCDLMLQCISTRFTNQTKIALRDDGEDGNVTTVGTSDGGACCSIM